MPKGTLYSLYNNQDSSDDEPDDGESVLTRKDIKEGSKVILERTAATRIQSWARGYTARYR